MQTKTIIKLFVLTILIACASSSININWISTVANSAVSPMAGSLMGGTSIHMSITGISQDPTMTTIKLQQQGSSIAYPCKIPADGVVEGALTCITTPSLNLQPISNFLINVFSVDENGNPTFASSSSLSSTSSSSVYFSYQAAYTPMIYDVFPGVAVGNTKLNYYGIHRISNLGDALRDTGDIIKIKVGDELCNLFGLTQASINPNAVSPIICMSSYLQEAGKYLVS